MKRGPLIAVSVLAWGWLAWWVITDYGWLIGLPLLIGIVALCHLLTTSPKKAKE